MINNKEALYMGKETIGNGWEYNGKKLEMDVYKQLLQEYKAETQKQVEPVDGMLLDYLIVFTLGALIGVILTMITL